MASPRAFALWAAALTVVALVAGAIAWLLKPTSAPVVSRFSHGLAQDAAARGDRGARGGHEGSSALTIGNTPHRWLRANAELARLHRKSGQEAKAREIETRLSKLLTLGMPAIHSPSN